MSDTFSYDEPRETVLDDHVADLGGKTTLDLLEDRVVKLEAEVRNLRKYVVMWVDVPLGTRLVEARA